MAAYIARRVMLMIPTMLGILFVAFVVVQFAPGGPVERVLAQLSGAENLRRLQGKEEERGLVVNRRNIKEVILRELFWISRLDYVAKNISARLVERRSSVCRMMIIPSKPN